MKSFDFYKDVRVFEGEIHWHEAVDNHLKRLKELVKIDMADMTVEKYCEIRSVVGSMVTFQEGLTEHLKKLADMLILLSAQMVVDEKK